MDWGLVMRATPLSIVISALLLLQSLGAQVPGTSPALPSDTPAAFAPVADSFDHVRRDVMVPMRDGVKLHTVILVPKGASRAPVLLTRTPYDATALTSYAQSAH